MDVTNLNVFLTNYIMSLSERTRVEKNSIKTGFDWIIYNLGLVKNWNPIRLPFFRNIHASKFKSKTEPEYGIDLAFLNPENHEFIIFVLKDEKLNNSNWIKNDFDVDLRKASAPDLFSQELSEITSVKIILAYNKDEDNTGITLFNNLVSTLGDKIRNNISLKFERWNITRITEEVKENLLSPDLLPQHLASLINYLCSQIADFDYGSLEWGNQLIPNWKHFLRIALKKPIDERKLRLIPIAVMILDKFRKNTPNSYPGWIDIMEWAMLALWDCYNDLKNDKLKKLIINIWVNLYVTELERYFLEIQNVIITEHGLNCRRMSYGLEPINDSYIAFWHLGRLGILTVASQELINFEKKESEEIFSNIINRSADWLIKCLRINPASLRPLIDLNHIELFLVWLILWQADRKNEIYQWLIELNSRLFIRRKGIDLIPFIESRNRLDLVAEYAATSEKPFEFTDKSSYLLLILLELCFSLDDKQRDQLLNIYYNRIVKGITDDGKRFVENEIDLISWFPPQDWDNRILKGCVNDGVAVVTNNFMTLNNQKEKSLAEKIRKFVKQSIKKFPFQKPKNIPKSVLILACIKHKSPLPSDFWRRAIFPDFFDKID